MAFDVRQRSDTVFSRPSDERRLEDREAQPCRFLGTGGKHPVTVAWLVLPGRTALNRIRNVAFGLIVGEESDRKLQHILLRWAEQFSADDFAERAGTKSWVVDWDAAAQHVDLLADRLAGILAELKAL